MALEAGSFIDDLVITNPLGTDAKNKGDDHLRLIKKVVKATFPSLIGAAWRVQNKSTAYTVVVGDNMTLINCTAALTLTLTAAATLKNQHMFLAHANGGDITIDPNGTENINGSSTSLTVPDGQTAIVFCDATEFYAIFELQVAIAGLSLANAFTGINTFSAQTRWTKGGDIASASPLVLGTDGNYFDVTGTTGFAAVTVAAGTLFMLQFDGVLTLTHHATNLDLPGEANITTAAGDVLIGFATGANTTQVLSYTKASGGSVKGSTSISNTSITAVTNIDVTGFASATYDNYEVWISNGQPGNDGVLLEMESSTDGGSTFDVGASDYSWAQNRITETATATPEGDADDTELNVTGTATVGNAANENINVRISVYRPEDTEFTTFTWNGTARNTTTLFFTFVGGGDRQSAADVDALRFHWSAGDWVAQGSIQFLGIAQ